MTSPRTNSSPSFKNLRSKHLHSPIELKEKMRKNYKDKVQNCRNMLLNRFRGPVGENDLCDKLTEIYKSMFDFSDKGSIKEEENEILEEIKNELVQEELQWWLEEYEKSQMENIDWSSIEQEDNVICPVCQKNNFKIENSMLICMHCNIKIKTQKSLTEIKIAIMSSLEKHNASCNNEVQFTVVPESSDVHIYLMCESCMEMQLVI